MSNSSNGQGNSHPQQPQHETDGDRHNTLSVCDACPHCDDICGNYDCERCASKIMKTRQHCCFVEQPMEEHEYTMCQIRRHGHEASAWLVAGDWIYDATQYILRHPGGSSSILKKSGGATDCTEDFHFHSKVGQRLWEKYKVGRVKPCPSHVQHTERQWWKFWDSLGN